MSAMGLNARADNSTQASIIPLTATSKLEEILLFKLTVTKSQAL